MRSIVLLFLLWASAQADTLILRNGTRVTGRWWASDADGINFLVNGRLEQYPRAEVSEVVFGDGPGADSAPAATAPVPPAAPTRAGSTGSAAPMVREPDQIGAVYFQDASGNLLPLEQTAAAGHRAPAGPGRPWRPVLGHAGCALPVPLAEQLPDAIRGGAAWRNRARHVPIVSAGDERKRAADEGRQRRGDDDSAQLEESSGKHVHFGSGGPPGAG